VTIKPPQDPVQGSFRGRGTPATAKTPLQNDENGLQNAPRDPDGQGDLSGENALVGALSGLFEKRLAKDAAEAAAGERGTGNGEQEEITQEQAEKLYEEIMAK